MVTNSKGRYCLCAHVYTIGQVGKSDVERAHSLTSNIIHYYIHVDHIAYYETVGSCPHRGDGNIQCRFERCDRKRIYNYPVNVFEVAIGLRGVSSDIKFYE